MAEFDYQWKYTLEKNDLENEEDKFECNEKRIKEFFVNINKFGKFSGIFNNINTYANSGPQKQLPLAFQNLIILLFCKYAKITCKNPNKLQNVN